VLALTALVALLAVAARVTGTFGVARWTSLERHEVRTICALVCARGATELVMPNVGANLRLLPAALYTPAVLMALITTVLSSVLDPVEPAEQRQGRTCAGEPAGTGTVLTHNLAGRSPTRTPMPPSSATPNGTT